MQRAAWDHEMQPGLHLVRAAPVALSSAPGESPQMMRPMASVTSTAAWLALAVLGSACATSVPFSRGYVDKFGLTGEDLQKTQFYLSDGIVLQRELVLAEQRLAKGRLRMIDGRLIECCRN
jgi:hypothetical protein